MALHNTIGHIGEDLANDRLTKNGYQVIHRNWRPPYGHTEVDLIAVKGNELIFVEVKTRTSDLFGAPEEYVDYKKQCHLFQAARAYLAHKTINGFFCLRFDVIAIILDKHTHECKSYRHIEDAFRPRPKYY